MVVSVQSGETFRRRIETARTLGRIPLDMALVDLPPHEDPDPVSDSYVLCFALRGTIAADFDFGDGWRKAIVPPGTFMPITPAQTLGRLMIDRPHRHLIVSLPRSAVTDIDAGANDFGQLHAAAFRDQLVGQLCMSLWTEAKNGHAMGDLYVDCARAALVVALRRRARQSPRRVETPHVFSPVMWQRIESEIQSRLGEALTVAMLAAPTGMPETRFLRAFKAKTGLAPYRYVLEKRVETATTMLANRTLSLVEIALATGFADQAHMTSAFARLIGRTPGQIRRGWH